LLAQKKEWVSTLKNDHSSIFWTKIRIAKNEGNAKLKKNQRELFLVNLRSISPYFALLFSIAEFS
jgi:hypothetical protein